MKFLCDEMLKKLGHWLRIAGYDVLMLPDGTADRELIERARHEGRVLLTRDRKITEFRSIQDVVVLLECNDLDACVTDLNGKLEINWLFQPFTRCSNCNTLLVKADDETEKRLPDDVINTANITRYCPSCDQLYWDGGHVKRMRDRLQHWNQAHIGLK